MATAQFLDGASPRRRYVRLRVTRDHLTLSFADGTQRTLAWREVKRDGFSAQRRQYALPPLPSHPVPGLLRVHEKALRKALAEVESLPRGVPRRLGLRSMPLLVLCGLALVLLPLLFLAYTRGLPMAHVLISTEHEARLGAALREHLVQTLGEVQDPELNQVLQSMVSLLQDPASPYHYRVTVLNSPEINALAAPGGELLLLRGLLNACDSPEALAGVLAHELAHVEQRHGLKHVLRSIGTLRFASGLIGGDFEDLELAETLTELSGLLLVLHYSREQEREADRIAVHKLHQAQISVRGLRDFFRRLEAATPLAAPALLSTHPHNTARIEGLSHQLARETFVPRSWSDQVRQVLARARITTF